MTDKLRASTRERLNYWLLLLKPGQCMEFSPDEYGISPKTLLAYLEAISDASIDRRYKMCSAGFRKIGVRRLRDCQFSGRAA